MPYDGITDEYSDYNIARSILGAGAVAGFGIISTKAIMSLNNSAFLQSLGKDFAKHSNYGLHPFGSTISSGSALHVSQMVKKSVEDFERLATPAGNLRQELAEAWKEVGASRVGFLDKVIARNQRVKAKAREKIAQDLETELNAGINNTIDVTKPPKSKIKDARKHFVYETKKNLRNNLRDTLEYLDSTEILHDTVLYRDRFTLTNVDGTETRVNFGHILDKRIRKRYEEVINTAKKFSNRLIPYNTEKLTSIKNSLDMGISRQDAKDKIQFIKQLMDDYGKRVSKGGTAIPNEYMSVLKKGITDLDSLLDVPESSRAFGSSMFGATRLSHNTDIYGASRLDDKAERIITRELIAGLDDQFPEDPLSATISRATPDGKLHRRISTKDSILAASIVDDDGIRNIAKEFAMMNERLEEYKATDMVDYIKNLANLNNTLTINEQRAVNELLPFVLNIEKGVAPTKDIYEILPKVEALFEQTNQTDASSWSRRTKHQLMLIDDAMNSYIGSLQKQLEGTKILSKTSKKLLRNISDFNVLSTNEKIAVINSMIGDYAVNIYNEDIRRNGELAIGIGDPNSPEVKRKTKRIRKRIQKEKLLEEGWRENRNLLSTVGRTKQSNKRIARNISFNNIGNRLLTVGSRAIERNAPRRKEIDSAWKELNFNNNTARGVIQRISNDVEQYGKTLSSSSSDRLSEMYSQLSNRRIGIFKHDDELGWNKSSDWSPTQIALGTKTPDQMFAETFTNADKGLKKISNSLKDVFGATDIDTAVRRLENGTMMEIKMVATLKDGSRAAPVRIKVPVMFGNKFYKKHRVRVAPMLSKFDGDKVHIMNPIQYILDTAINHFDRMKGYAHNTSLEKEEVNGVLREINKKIQNQANFVFGKGGTGGLTFDITDASEADAIKQSMVIQDIELAKKSSSMEKRKLKYMKRLRDMEYLSMKRKGIYNASELNNMRMKIRDLQDRIETMQYSSIDQGSTFIKKLARTKNVKSGSYEGEVESMIRATYMRAALNISAIADVNIVKGKFSMVNEVGTVIEENVARGTKAMASATDTFDDVLELWKLKHDGYDLTDGRGISLKDELNAGFLVTRLKNNKNGQIESHIKQQFKIFNGAIDVTSKEYQKELEQIKKTLNTNILPELKRLRKIPKKSIAYTMRDSPIAGQIQTAEDNLQIFNKRRRDIYKILEKLKKKKYALTKANRIVKHYVRRGLYMPSSSSDVFLDNIKGLDPTAYDEIAEAFQDLTGKTYKEYFKTPTKSLNIERNHNIDIITRDRAEQLAERGMMPYDQYGRRHYLGNNAAQPILKTMYADIAVGGEGVGFLSEDAVAKFGNLVDRGNTNTVTVSSIIEALKTTRGRKPELSASIKFAIDALDQLKTSTDTFSLELIEDKYGRQGLSDILTAMNSALNYNAEAKGFMRYGTDQVDMIRSRDAHALFSGFEFDGKGKVKIKYDFVHSVLVRSKIITEDQHKFLVNGILSKEHMLRRQREEVMRTVSKLGTVRQNSELKTFVNHFLGIKKEKITDSTWSQFTEMLKGVNNRSAGKNVQQNWQNIVKTVEAIHGGNVAELLTTTKRMYHSSTSVGVMRMVFGGILDKDSVKATVGNQQGKELVQDVLSDIIGVFTGGQIDVNATKHNRLKRKRLTGAQKYSMEQTGIRTEIMSNGGVNTNVDSYGEMTAAIKKLLSNDPSAQLSASMINDIRSLVKSRIKKDKTAGLNTSEKNKVINEIMTDVETFITMADKKAMPLQILFAAVRATATTQNAFELNTVSKAKYSVITGWEGGAKLSLHDLMNIRLHGMTKFYSKAIAHMKHGQEFFDTYMATALKMINMDPNEYLGKRVIGSGTTRQGLAQAEMSMDLLKFKDGAHKDYRDPETVSDRKIKKKGLLDIADEEIDDSFLGKGLISKEQEDLIKLDNGEYDPHVDIEDGVRKKMIDDLREIDLNEIRTRPVSEQIKMLQTTSQYLRVEEVGEYQKLLRRYKEVHFLESSTDKTLFGLHMNTLGNKRVASLPLQRFAESEILGYVDSGGKAKGRHFIHNGRYEHIRGYQDINIVEQAIIDGGARRTDVVMLNKVLRDQLVMLRAMHWGMDQDVINMAADKYATSVGEYTREIKHKQLSKRLPATVRGSALAIMDTNLERLNAWEVLADINKRFGSKLGLGIDGKNIFNLTRKKAMKHLKTALSGDHAADVKDQIESFLEVGRERAATTGKIYMSRQDMMEALKTVMGKDEAKQIAEEVIKGQRTWMSLGVRYPVLRPENTMPMSVHAYDHQLLTDLRMGNKTLAEEFNAKGAKGFLGSTMRNLYLSASDAASFGGDFDRDQYLAILGVSNRNDDIQIEMRNKMKRQLRFNYERVDVDGKRYSIAYADADSIDGGRSANVFNEISEDIGDGYSKEYRKRRKKGQNYSIYQYLDDRDIEIAKVDDGKFIFRGESRKIIDQSLTYRQWDKKTQSININKKIATPEDKMEKQYAKKRVLFFEDMNTKGSLLLENKLADAARETQGFIELSDDELDKLAKKKGYKSTTEFIKAKRSDFHELEGSYRRILMSSGMSPYEIDAEVEHAKMTEIENKGSLSNRIAGRYRKNMEAAANPILAVKTLTGNIYNTAKFLVSDIAESVLGGKKAATVSRWAAELSQVNISGKHKIPVVTEDVIDTIRTIYNPHASEVSLYDASKKIKKGEFKAILSDVEISDIFNTNRLLNKNAKDIRNSKTASSMSEIRQVVEEISDGRAHRLGRQGITNLQYLKYLKAKQNLSSDTRARRLLNIDDAETKDIAAGIKGTEKGWSLARDNAEAILKTREPLMEMMQQAGIKNINDLQSMKFWHQALPKEGYETFQQLAKFKRGLPMLLIGEQETARIVLPGLINSAKSNAYASIYHNESVARSVSTHLGSTIQKKVENSRLSNFIDGQSFAKYGFAGLAGIAAIGFIGAFGMQSNKRAWLGSTAGTGGEYSERNNRKDEERLASKEISERIRSRAGQRVGSLHYNRPKDARLLQNGIREQKGSSLADQIRAFHHAASVDTSGGFTI